jgi:hypothetical protein
MSDRAFRVFMVLDGRARTDPFCFPGNEWIRARTGKSGTALVEIFAELEGAGWLRRVFTEAKKKERIGFILLRRVDPDLPAADTPDRIAQAEASLRARVEGQFDSGNPLSRDPETAEIRQPRRRKSAIKDAGNPSSPDSGFPATYKDSVVIVRNNEKESGARRGDSSASLSNDNDRKPTQVRAKPMVGYDKTPAEYLEWYKNDRAPEPTPPIAAALGKTMAEIQVSQSFAGEPTTDGTRTPGQMEFLEAMGPELRYGFSALSPGKQREILAPHAEKYDPQLLGIQSQEIRRVKVPKVREQATTFKEVLEALSEGDAAYASTFAEVLVHEFGTKKDAELWPAFHQLAKDVFERRVKPEDVLDSHRQAMSPEARNRGAVFRKALGNHGWRPK